MVLYWNDVFWYYDKMNKKKCKPEFVLVRKLYIPSVSETAINKDIEKRFRPFGKIEEVSIHKHKYCTGYYAFVTFADSKSAYKALEKCNRKLKVKILPADTWKQPEVPDKQMHFDCFEQLNEYCVIHILSFLEYDTWLDLANVSYRLKNLVNNISYPKQEYLEFNFDRSDTFPLAPTTLARMRQTLLHLGQHLKSVKINFNSEIKPPNCDRIVETFVKYLGPNLKTLCISGLILTNENISKFVPILQQIETLKLSALNEDYGPDLTQICVNLKKLRISHDTSFWSISQPWQKLENLSLASCEFDTERMLDELFLNNPQLKRLNIPVYDQSRVFSVIASFLEDLEKLTVYNDGGLGVSSSHISKLLDLRMLRILKLKYIGGPCVDEILHTLTQLRELTHLEISVYISTQNFKPDPSVILNIARNLTNLNYFHLENCDIKETIILDFIKIATHLKKFAYINFEFQPNIDFFSKILEICQNDKRDLELVFSLFSNEAVNLWFKEDEVKRYLKISRQECTIPM